MNKSKLTKVGYELESVHIVQAPISYINHRVECDPMIDFCGRKVYPVIVSPMGSVTDENNYKIWLQHGFICVVPRTVQDIQKRIEIAKETFASFSLSEAESLLTLLEPNTKYYICIDIAHGTMRRLYSICNNLKEKYDNNIVIMTGNVANPEAYPYYCVNKIDLMRATIGTGSRCLVEGTKIKMADNTEENIENIDVGDFVKTIKGNKKVLNIFQKKTNKTIIINNEIESTYNHKFLVVKKSEINGNETEKEILEKSFYLEAEKLSDEYLLVQG